VRVPKAPLIGRERFAYSFVAHAFTFSLPFNCFFPRFPCSFKDIVKGPRSFCLLFGLSFLAHAHLPESGRTSTMSIGVRIGSGENASFPPCPMFFANCSFLTDDGRPKSWCLHRFLYTVSFSDMEIRSCPLFSLFFPQIQD